MSTRASTLLWMYGGLLAFMAAGYGVLFALLDDFRDAYGMGESALGAVIGLGFFAGFLAQLLIAPLADRGHARRLVVAGVLVNVAGLVLTAFSTSFIPLLTGRFVMGIGVGTAVPAIRRIVILAEPDRLGNNLGRLFAFDIAGFAAGPAVSAVLAGPFGIPAPFLVIAAATLLALPLVARTTVVEAAEPARQRFAFDLLRIRPFAGAVLLGCALWLMVGAFDALWAVVLDDQGTAEWVSNVGLTLFALPLILFGALGGRLAQRVGPFRVGTVGLLGGAAAMLVYGLVPTGEAMLAVAMVHAVNDGLTVSSAGIAAGMVVPAERQAGGQGVLGACSTLTAGVTALVAGTLYEHAGRTVAYAAAAGAMVVLVAAGARLAGPAWGLRSRTDVASSSAPEELVR